MDGDELPICVACGSQYDSADGQPPPRCKVCDDPRQFVPPSGQQWTTLADLRQTHKNKIVQDDKDENVWHIFTGDKFGIGQRAIFITTPNGNVLWDLIALLDESTISFINHKGGLSAIVISHPHFYTTYAEWSKRLNCPVHISDDDSEWLCRRDESCIKWIKGPVGTSTTIVDGVTAVKCGGHFPGSLVLHWGTSLGISDTLMTVPSAYTPHPRPPGQTTYSFMWSIPNMIPLEPGKIHSIWRAIRDFEFERSYGNFNGMTVADKDLKRRTLASMKVQVRAMGYEGHPLLEESVP